MATTGTRISCGTGTLCNTTTICGQGTLPDLWCLYSTDDASVTTPSWMDATHKVRQFATSRGRENELAEVDAGTATLVLDNRERDFDPVAEPLIRPMNRWWIREQFTGETQSIFYGYAESYDQLWNPPNDAYAVVTCSDEFSRLARGRLPVTNPPRDSYADVVMFDAPVTYWRFSDPSFAAVAGTAPKPTTVVLSNETPIVGEMVGDSELAGGCVSISASQIVAADAEAGDPAGASAFTVEVWFKRSGLPSSDREIIRGPGNATNSNPIWALRLNTTGTLSFRGTTDTFTDRTVTGATVTADLTWYHVVAKLDSGNLKLFVNGVQDGTTSWVDSTFYSAMTANAELQLQAGASLTFIRLDELAIYRNRALPDARISAHHIAGTARGFPVQTTGGRVNAILDAVGSTVPRDVDAGMRDIIARYMNGQDSLGEIRVADRADDPDSIFFVGRDGTFVFLDGDHRLSSPYNTVQATFDDDGTDLEYHDLDVDYSDAFLFNDYNGSRVGGGLISASDTTSINTYGKRSQSETDLPVTDDVDAQAILDALLAKHKDPMTRVLSITLKTSDPDLTETIFRRDLGDRIRILRTPPGGGTRIDRTVFIQKVSVSGVPGVNGSLYAVVTWAVSPL